MPISRAGFRDFSFTPALDTNAYADGDQLGPGSTEIPKAVLGENGSNILTQLTVTDGAKQAKGFDLYFWNSQPTVSSTDNNPFDVSDSEIASKLVAIVSVGDSDYKTIANNSSATVRNLEAILKAVKNGSNPTGTSIWVSLVARGAATYAASSLKIKLFCGS